MKIKIYLSILCCTFFTLGSASEKMRNIVDLGLKRAEIQSEAMAEALMSEKGKLPRSVTKDDKILLVDAPDWTSGFFAGTLWYLYENFKTDNLKKYAEEYSDRVRNEQYTTDNHDIGFMIFNSFGNGYRITQNPDYKQVVEQAAMSLSTRYRDNLGVIRSWDFNSKEWPYPVIIDNMMNLEMLLWVAKESKMDRLKDIALSHANTTMKNHFRDDYSSYHLVVYDPALGNPIEKRTVQGYSSSSAWARGQAWGLYGYTMMYRETKDPAYLKQAEEIAKFIMSHPNLPKDKIPYWDFNDPDIPNTYRDASAAAVMASAFIELHCLTSGKLSKEYLQIAEQQIKTMSSPEYLAAPHTNHNYILMHSVGYKAVGGDLDKPINYTDYYYVEALIRYKKWILKDF